MIAGFFLCLGAVRDLTRPHFPHTRREPGVIQYLRDAVEISRDRRAARASRPLTLTATQAPGNGEGPGSKVTAADQSWVAKNRTSDPSMAQIGRALA